MGVLNTKKAAERAQRIASGENQQKKNRDNENALYETAGGPVLDRGSQKASSRKEKAMDGIPQGCVDWLKENLGVDLNSDAVTPEQVWDLRKGKMTGPFSVTVTPEVFDRSRKTRVEAPAIRALVSMKVGFPVENRRFVEPDKEHRMFVQTLPVRPEILKGEPQAAAGAAGPAKEEEMPMFGNDQIRALEGIGVNPDRLFHGRNAFTVDQKRSILAGEPFEYAGSVRTKGGVYVNFYAEGRLDGDTATVEPVVMRTLEDKSRVAALASVPEEEFAGLKRSDFQIDILDAAHQGGVEFDLFQRNSENAVVKGADGLPLLNDAGRNLLEYGSSMGPVAGWYHGQGDKVKKAFYHLSVVNGSILGEAMKEIPILGKDGKPMKREVWSSTKKRKVTVPLTKAVVRDITNEEGRVFVDGARKPCEFASEKDLDAFRLGRAAKVKDLVYHDFRTGKDQTYDGYVVYDAARVFARPFTPQTSRKIEAALTEKEAHKTTLKRKTFGIG